MIPPWVKHPEIKRYSIGWRMGYGEGYYNTFYQWFSHLNTEKRTRYTIENPETDEWTGFYQRIAEHPWL